MTGTNLDVPVVCRDGDDYYFSIHVLDYLLLHLDDVAPVIYGLPSF